jgi:hypothetical protein
LTLFSLLIDPIVKFTNSNFKMEQGEALHLPLFEKLNPGSKVTWRLALIDLDPKNLTVCNRFVGNEVPRWSGIRYPYP